MQDRQPRAAYFLIMLSLFLAGTIGFLVISGYGENLAPEWMGHIFELDGGEYSAGALLWILFGFGALVFTVLLIRELLRRLGGKKKPGGRISANDVRVVPKPISALPALREELETILTAREHSAVRIVNHVLSAALSLSASDIHLSPEGDGTRVTLRVHGLLYELGVIDAMLHPPIVSRIKVVSDLEIFTRQRPQDGRLDMPAEGEPAAEQLARGAQDEIGEGQSGHRPARMPLGAGDDQEQHVDGTIGAHEHGAHRAQGALAGQVGDHGPGDGVDEQRRQ